MPQITEDEFRRQIKTESFSKIYVLYGEETYLVGSAAQRLIRKANAENHFLDFNYQKFDSDASIDEISDAVTALPFMAKRKCVAVSGLDIEALGNVQFTKLKELAAMVPKTTVLIFYQNTKPVSEKKAAAKFKQFLSTASKNGCTVEFKRREQAELEKYLCAFAARRNCRLTRADAGRIVFLSGNDLQTLLNETEKLCAYAKQKGEITREDIDKLVSRNMETTVFMLSKALASGNYNRAYELLDQLFFQKEEPVAILAVMASVFIDMYRVRAALQSGKSALQAGEPFNYKGKEFRLRNAERDSHGLSTGILRKILKELLQTDLQLKSLRTDSRILLEELIARMLVITKEESSV